MSSHQLPLNELYHTTPLIFAHRGARRDAPENTIAAFERAVVLGCDGIEIDVQFCKGDRVVVFHDERLGRTCEGSVRIADLPMSELSTIDVGSHFSSIYSNEKIPTLDQVFEAVGQKLLINVEIKHFNRNAKLPSAVFDIIRHHSMEHRVIISSFNPMILRNMRRLSPAIPLGFLHEAETPLIFRSDNVVRGIIGRYEARHPNYSTTEKAYIEWAHQHQYRVNVWTVNDTADILRMLETKVDAIISDVPDLALRLRADQTRIRLDES